jgi:uncharacterized membrane protein YkvA (DUF1232 family)
MVASVGRTKFEGPAPDALGGASALIKVKAARSAQTLGRSQRDERKRVHILLACMPKSGSTFVADMIGQLPGFYLAPLIPIAGRREQELDELCLQKADDSDYVAQVHVRHSDWTEDMCRDYGLTPVVLVRNLFDVVVSLRDHVRNESASWPNFFAEPHHGKLDDDALELMIAQLALPWYINFYMGWRRASDVLMIDYDEVVQAPTKVVNDILDFADARVPAADVNATIAKVRAINESRFNVGVAGRGRGLSPATVRAVLELVAHYPEADADPYIQTLKAQGAAILAGTAPPPPVVAPRPAVSRKMAMRKRDRKRNVRSLAIGRIAPLLLLVLGVLYWIWPNDLVPDSHAFGYVDDAAILLIFAFLAGRLTKYKAKRQGLRPERQPAARSARG